jgi:uncharacterized membrane protein
MSLPTIEPLPDENASLPPARRRRLRRTISSDTDQAGLLRELSHRTVPSFDFFLFSLLAGIVLGIALLADSPALIILAALLAPFMAPMIGISLGSITGAMTFLLQSLGSMTIGSLIVFLCGTVAGWAVHLLPNRIYQQAVFHSEFTWPDLILLSLGAGLTAYLIARAPSQKPLVTSVAIAYGLYLPVGTAGFGLSSGIPGLWPGGLLLFFVHLVWAALVGSVVFWLLKLRPQTAAGYLLSVTYALVGVIAVVLMSSQPAPARVVSQIQPTPGATASAGVEASTPSPSPTITQSATPSPVPNTATPTPTRTLVFTQTATLTITPQPTPVWARINASEGNGALIRERPNYEAEVVQSLLNGSLVEVLNEVQTNGTVAWVRVRTVNGKEGWIVRSLLRTATPAPGW